MSGEEVRPEIAALIWLQHDAASYIPTVASLRAALPSMMLFVGGPHGPSREFDRWGALPVDDLWLVHAVETISEPKSPPKPEQPVVRPHLLIISEPVILPPAFLDRALAAIDDDIRIATVSFLSNAAGGLSVPQRNVPGLHQVGPHDEVSITRLLRTLEPDPAAAPIAAPVGPVTLLSRFALGAVDGLDRTAGVSAAALVSDFGLRAGQRGFVNVVDGGTYYTRAMDLAQYVLDPIDLQTGTEYEVLNQRHSAAILRHQDDKARSDSPLGLAVQTAAAKIRGLRIIIDGRDVGQKETGTQVATLSLARELARRPDVEAVQLALPGPPPVYAQSYLSSQKISVFHSANHDMSGASFADVIHRPSQPSSEIPFDAWRSRALRVMVTLQDLIAYQVGAYFASGDDWLTYRHNLVGGAAAADGVFALSDETRRQIEAERLPLESDRLFVVPSGTDHLLGVEPDEHPAELMARGFVGEEFLVVIGMNYGHKNRDLALQAWQWVRLAFPHVALVLAGAYVPHGSSRVAESAARRPGDSGIFVLPDVSSPERNWLLRHARVVLYPTSAEGFGLVPFEAARFGTPTVGVGMRPVREFNSTAPEWADSWDPRDLARTIGRLLQDPALATEQVRQTLLGADQYTWAETAAASVRAYRTILSLPARWPATR
ncbi:MAG: glycosyltransferase [Ilumatobacteraceae bacterium]